MTSLTVLTEKIDLFIEFIDRFKELLKIQQFQFLIDNHWENNDIINPKIRADLDKLVEECDKTNQAPNLLKIYMFGSKYPMLENIDELFVQLKNLNKIWEDEVLTSAENLFDSNNKELARFEENFLLKFSQIGKQNRFMNEKKTYEVDVMSKFVAKLCKSNNINTIVDIGSGRAYLSSQLSSPIFDSEFNVIAIDSSESNVESSKKRLNVLKRKTTIYSTSNQNVNNSDNEVQSQNQDLKSKNFKTFSQFIQSTTELNNLIEKQNIKTSDENNAYALIGLHTCGNLSNSIINLYLNKMHSTSQKEPYNKNHISPKLLCNIACCYDSLDEKYSYDDEISNSMSKNNNVQVDNSSKFPMSLYLNNKKYYLNFNTRRLACHSLASSLNELDSFKELNNLSFWFRTVLQVILIEKFYSKIENKNNPDCRSKYVLQNKSKPSDIVDPTHIQVGRFLIREKKDPILNFVSYARNAFNNLGFENHETEINDKEIEEYYNKFSKFKSKFDLYIQLKLLISPIIEYVILLDRLIYLTEEQNLSKNFLIRLFDGVKSPRCHAMVSYK